MKNAAEQLFQLGIPTPKGAFLATYSAEGLCSLAFPRGPQAARGVPQTEVPAQVRSWHTLTVASVKNVLSGRPAGKLPPLDYASGTEFQRNVWAELSRIKSGQTRSYGEVARAIGHPKAARAVGAACGANRIPLLIPCHRVLASNKKLGGFSGGLDWKRLLLLRERSWPGK